MATSALSNHPIALAVASSSSTAPSRPCSSSAAPARIRRSPNPGCSSSCLAPRIVPISRRRLGVRNAGSDTQMLDSEDDALSQHDCSGDALRGPFSVQVLIQSYKEAIINEDEKTMKELEVAIYNIEKEKNELLNKIGRITSEIALGKENFIRLNADFENFRKRSDKDRLNFTSRIQEEVIESLIPLVDSFERTKQQSMAETEKEKKILTSYQGIYKQFVEIMRTLRVSVVETIGKQFDPLVHEAVARVDSNQFREGTILQEVQRGFLLGERVIRPAKVKVSNGPSKNAAPPSENPAEESIKLAESRSE